MDCRPWVHFSLSVVLFVCVHVCRSQAALWAGALIIRNLLKRCLRYCGWKFRFYFATGFCEIFKLLKRDLDLKKFF